MAHKYDAATYQKAVDAKHGYNTDTKRAQTSTITYQAG